MFDVKGKLDVNVKRVSNIQDRVSWNIEALELGGDVGCLLIVAG